MSARLVWIVECEVCRSSKEFDGSLSEPNLGVAITDSGWELPRYGGTFCPRCAKAVRELSERKEP